MSCAHGKSILPDSYAGKIKHVDLRELESAVAEKFVTGSEYFLGITDERIFVCDDPSVTAIYAVRGHKMGENKE